MATITSPRSESPANPIPRITSPQIPHSPSISGTPTSSVRHSIDIPVRTNSSSPSLPLQQQNAGSGAASATAGGPQQRRNRAALRDYYNLKAKASSSGGAGAGAGTGGGSASMHSVSRTASIASNASDYSATNMTGAPDASTSVSDAALAAQLDDPSFDAEAHVAELLQQAGLRDILRTESVLVSEIRTLDGERKALVYDNYSKLIKAVGTIAEMQKGMHKGGGGDRGYGSQQDRFGAAAAAALGRNDKQRLGLEGVERLGEKLDALVTVVKELAPAAEVDSEAQAGRGRQQKNRDLKRQKETVRWALDAPSRLEELVARREHDEARRDYEAVLEVLAGFKNVRGVDEVRSKCARIMVNARRNSVQSEDDEEHDSEADDSG